MQNKLIPLLKELSPEGLEILEQVLLILLAQKNNEKKDPKVGSKFVHVGSEGLYQILFECIIKDEKTKEWKEGLIYKSLTNQELKLCVRERENFKERFVSANNDENE